jgi:hypothetical protein
MRDVAAAMVNSDSSSRAGPPLAAAAPNPPSAAAVSARWVIEAKGGGSLNPMRVNYFLAVLGELLQRMSDPCARHVGTSSPTWRRGRT